LRHSVNKTNKYEKRLCYEIYVLQSLTANKQNETPNRTCKFNLYIYIYIYIYIIDF